MWRSPVLHAIVDADLTAAAGWTVVDLARAMLAGGAQLVQIRAKRTGSGALLQWCDQIVEEARRWGATVVVNDRADLARLSGASGVHVGQHDLPPLDVRVVAGQAAILGLSTHTGAQIDAALREPITYVAVGPVFGTATKTTGNEPVGLDLVRRAHGRGLPVVAIGGITLETAPSVIDAGAAAVAVISDLLSTGDPEQRTRAYIRRLSRAG